jgi:hypothetical protein
MMCVKKRLVKNAGKVNTNYARVSGLPDGICIFKPKIPIWVNFEGGLAMEDILWPFGLFYCHLVI